MNKLQTERSVALVVTNPQALQHGSTPRHRFDVSGGTIGGHGANWTLVDKAGRVQLVHCEIRFSDGAFCVIDRSGQTHINDARDPLGRSVGARLSEGDILHIGPYMVAVHLHDERHELPDSSRHLAQYEVSELLNEQRGGSDDLPSGAYSFDQEQSTPGADAAFQALATQRDPRSDLDPLRALDVAEHAAAPKHPGVDPSDAARWNVAHTPTQPDLASTRFAAVSGSPQTTSGDSRMSKSRDHFLSDQDWAGSMPAVDADPSQAAAPLLQGLGVSLGSLDTQASHTLMLEAGQALGAAIRGIAELYGSQAGDQRRMALSALTLQPIEDNPLRLGQSYQDTLRAMFSSERSVVHLSPKAAIDESMTQLRAHHAAVMKGIEASLEALLRAFSPDLLLQRFHRYRPEQAQKAGADDWAWRMYTHYYEELSSVRQRGFEKLFWEIFEQAYDRALRAEVQ
ncbi:type VI secretion system-associated FHA domain protein TagH [Achromobacter sp. NPDC058515]|uniref:type VI secretion system-associated FHA domain protein TagH n=1 Tax=Achromobacter sp. NPDC058515 TaxID=3346533 RepID=UPI00366369F2